MNMELPSVSSEQLAALKIADNETRATARKAGRTHELAAIPARPSRKRAAEDEEQETVGVQVRRRRLCRKSRPELLLTAQPSRPAHKRGVVVVTSEPTGRQMMHRRLRRKSAPEALMGVASASA